MKKSIFILAMLLWTISAIAQQYEEVVYLKNGSRIKGTVIEMTSERVRIEIYDGSILTYKSDEVEKIVKEKGLVQITDTKAIEAIVDKAIADNPKAVSDYPKSMGFLVGQVMKASKGKANPGLVNKLIKEKLG